MMQEGNKHGEANRNSPVEIVVGVISLGVHGRPYAAALVAEAAVVAGVEGRVPASSLLEARGEVGGAGAGREGAAQGHGGAGGERAAGGEGIGAGLSVRLRLARRFLDGGG